LSDLKVNQISKYSGTHILLNDSIDMQNNSVTGAATITVTQLNAQGASASTAGLMSITDKTRLDALHANALVDTDFSGTVGFLKKTGTNSYALDESEYITGNEQITITGDVGDVVTGVSGTTEFDLELNTDAIIGKPDTTTVNATNDRILIASYSAGNYVLKKVSPENFGTGGGGGGTVANFDPSKGIEVESVVEDTVTLQLNYLAIDTLNSLASSDVQSADEFMLRDDSTQQLKKLTYSDLSTKLAGDIGGGEGGGGYIIGGIVTMNVNSNMELYMEHTGAFDSSNCYLNSNNELILES